MSQQKVFNSRVLEQWLKRPMAHFNPDPAAFFTPSELATFEIKHLFSLKQFHAALRPLMQERTTNALQQAIHERLQPRPNAVYFTNGDLPTTRAFYLQLLLRLAYRNTHEPFTKDEWMYLMSYLYGGKLTPAVMSNVVNLVMSAVMFEGPQSLADQSGIPIIRNVTELPTLPLSEEFVTFFDGVQGPNLHRRMLAEEVDRTVMIKLLQYILTEHGIGGMFWVFKDDTNRSKRAKTLGHSFLTTHLQVKTVTRESPQINALGTCITNIWKATLQAYPNDFESTAIGTELFTVEQHTQLIVLYEAWIHQLECDSDAAKHEAEVTDMKEALRHKQDEINRQQQLFEQRVQEALEAQKVGTVSPDTQKEISDLRNEIADKKDQIGQQEKFIKRATEKIETLAKQKAGVENEYRLFQETQKDQIEATRKVNEQLENQNQNLSEQNEKLQEANVWLHQEYDKLKSQHQALQEKLMQLEAEKGEWLTSLEKERNERQQMQLQVSRIREEAEEKIALVEARNLSLQQEKDELTTQLRVGTTSFLPTPAPIAVGAGSLCLQEQRPYGSIRDLVNDLKCPPNQMCAVSSVDGKLKGRCVEYNKSEAKVQLTGDPYEPAVYATYNNNDTRALQDRIKSLLHTATPSAPPSEYQAFTAATAKVVQPHNSAITDCYNIIMQYAKK